MKIGHTMPELQPFTFHEKFVAHPVYHIYIYNIMYYIDNDVRVIIII